jgi:hypothetical protein
LPENKLVKSGPGSQYYCTRITVAQVYKHSTGRFRRISGKSDYREEDALSIPCLEYISKFEMCTRLHTLYNYNIQSLPLCKFVSSDTDATTKSFHRNEQHQQQKQQQTIPSAFREVSMREDYCIQYGPKLNSIQRHQQQQNICLTDTTTDTATTTRC